MEKSTKSITKYLEGLSKKDQEVFNVLLNIVYSINPNIKGSIYTGKFWNGSDQNIIAFKDISMIKADKTQVEWFALGLARQKNYFSIYVNVYNNDNIPLIEVYKSRLGKVKTSKTSLNFTKLESVNLDILTELFKQALKMWKKIIVKVAKK
ncbi:hypothetical protein [Mycoplasma sp. P36-A1]|uniref:hypothetical protein n=1 Tax=Mycoplasma sp. P36-A1 TaxID=3252900 RepID=UPI003C2B3262